jgi:kynurenine 3-monooxygenase
MTLEHGSINIVGAGPTGALLAILLQRRGFRVTVYESRRDPRGSGGQSGRSINLALADRGIHALKRAGVYDAIAGTLVPMRGRRVHLEDGSEALHLYGQRPNEVIYSISRHRLNQALLDMAVNRHGVDVRFEHRLEDADFDSATCRIRDVANARTVSVAMRPLLATDGAGSVARRLMVARGLIDSHEGELDHGYKELPIPPNGNGDYAMAADALHIWPRGNFMLIALPNIDATFTATLFLAKRGPVSFATLNSPPAIEEFLALHFPDVCPLMPDRVAEFQSHPTGTMGTVSAAPWHAGGMMALVGDAAHAIVPFHGQGMNCCFEDCVEFDACIERNSSWESLFRDFDARRKPDTDAIAAMALENYLEMRERVADPEFRLQQILALELERRHPRRFIPRYSMVMFHHEIPYRVALERGRIQAKLLADLAAGMTSVANIDYQQAGRRIDDELSPLPGD